MHLPFRYKKYLRGKGEDGFFFVWGQQMFRRQEAIFPFANLARSYIQSELSPWSRKISLKFITQDSRIMLKNKICDWSTRVLIYQSIHNLQLTSKFLLFSDDYPAWFISLFFQCLHAYCTLICAFGWVIGEF